MPEKICPLTETDDVARSVTDYNCPCAVSLLLREELEDWAYMKASILDGERALVHTRRNDAKLTPEQLLHIRTTDSDDYETPDGWTRTETEEFELFLLRQEIDRLKERICHICRFGHPPVTSHDRRQRLLFDLPPDENETDDRR